MPAERELAAIVLELTALENQFSNTPAGPRLSMDGEADFKRLASEAKSLLDSALGYVNDFSFNLMPRSFFGGISPAVVKTARGQVQGGINQIQRQGAVKPAPRGVAAPSYVTPSRLLDLRRLTGRSFDPTRLVRLCEELNVAHANECYMTTAILVRSIVDHVPPAFECKDFAEVANNHQGPPSFKRSMLHLQNSLRNIADQHLHTHMRQRESLPAASQVDFKQDIDVLLSEVVRILK